MPIWLLGVLFSGGAALLADRARALVEAWNESDPVTLEHQRNQLIADCLSAQRDGQATSQQCGVLFQYLGVSTKPAVQSAAKWSEVITPAVVSVSAAILSTLVIRRLLESRR